MQTLRRKLARELWQLRMQMLSIALVVATAVMMVVTMRGSYVSLVDARDAYYLHTRFADIWAPLVRAPLGVRERLAAIAGVAAVDTRITLLATLDLADLDMPAQGRFVSLPAYGRPLLNDLQLISGRYLASGARNEVLISEKFALARGLQPGDSVNAVINGRSQSLEVVGVASSPEHSYAVPPGGLLPENERYGIFWISESFLGPAWNMEGAFNEVLLRLEPDALAPAVMAQVDAVLEPWGGLGAYAREEQLSHLILDNELNEIRVMGTVLPAIFLGVAVFLLHQVLGRLITTQRGEIAVLKAFGYSDRETGWHFLGFALLPVGLGALIGGFGGGWLGTALVGLYAEFLEIPALDFRFSPGLLVFAVGLSLAGALSGAWRAVRGAMALPPAEAMRPAAPVRFRPGPLESLGLGRWLSSSGRMILRNLERRPLHALFSVLGVASAMAILVIGLFMFDSINYLIDMQFRQIQREDLALGFREEVGAEVRYELARLPGVTRVEIWRAAPARLRAEQRRETVAITGLDPGGQLRRIVNRAGQPQPLPLGGIILSTILAEKLAVVPGDTLELEWLDGKRLHTRVTVSGLLDDYIGVSAYMQQDTLQHLSGSAARATGAWLKTDGSDPAALYRRLKQLPAVSGVASPQSMLATFDEQMARSLVISSAFMFGFASVIAFGVIYNGARIALSERSRELASLRVLGFHRSEVARLLLGEQLLLTVLALPCGAFCAFWAVRAIVGGVENDSYRIPFVAEPRTYVLAGGMILLAAFVSMIAVRRRLDRVDLVSVLKTRE